MKAIPMPTRLVITLHALIFVFVLPMLEVGPTHVFNPDWPGHARLHNAWQLMTNASLALIATALAWRSASQIMALILSLSISVPFLIAFASQRIYGGTMQHSDGSELLIGGINPAFGLLLLFAVLLTAALIKALRQETFWAHQNGANSLAMNPAPHGSDPKR